MLQLRHHRKSHRSGNEALSQENARLGSRPFEATIIADYDERTAVER
jgi:hypothetical protein